MRPCIYLSGLLLLLSCGTTTSEEDASWERPPEGTLIAADSMKINDPLNEFQFTVKLIAGDSRRKGNYKVQASYGPVTGQDSFTMPRRGENLRPLLRRCTEPDCYVIGFQMESDTAFYDYYQVKGIRGALEMKYTKAYSIPE